MTSDAEGFLAGLRSLWRWCKAELLGLGLALAVMAYCLREWVTYRHYRDAYLTRLQPLLEALGWPPEPYTPGVHGPGFPVELTVLLWLSAITAILAIVAMVLRTRLEKRRVRR